MSPNFFIVGAAKSGTTSLYHYLSEHPDIFMTEPKEINFFAFEDIQAQGLYYNDFVIKNFEDYLKLFSDSQDFKIRGEASVSYIFYPKVAQRIFDKFPDSKIVIILRNPIERAFSHYLMDQRLGLVDLSFDDIVFKTKKHKHNDLYFQQYIELGLYYEQVKRYLDVFGKDNVKVYLNDDLKEDIESVIENLYSFLHVENIISANLSINHNSFTMPKNRFIGSLYASHKIRTFLSKIVPVRLKDKLFNLFFDKTNKPSMSEKSFHKLSEYYTNDLTKLSGLIERDLSSWREK